MYRDRGGGGGSSKSEIVGGALDRKRINDALDKHLEKLSPSTSKEKAVSSIAAGAGGKLHQHHQQQIDHRGDNRSSSAFAAKNKCSEESETDSEDSDVSGSDGDDTSWISCQVPYYDYALDLILDVESSHGDMFTEEQNELVESAAEMLYGLIHVRYILTTKGMAAMLEKYKNYDFGRCPRVFCCGQPCLPVGQSDIPRSSTVKIYCPKCEDIYYPRSKYQGTQLKHAFHQNDLAFSLLTQPSDGAPYSHSTSGATKIKEPEVLAMLADFHLLDLLPQTGTITST
nr:putative casein kinase II subunit beta-4 [Ipomoea batatas]